MLGEGAVVGRGAEERTINLNVAKLQVFNRDSSKISGFMIYIRNRLVGAIVEEQM